jgi:hypothetical protein
MQDPGVQQEDCEAEEAWEAGKEDPAEGCELAEDTPEEAPVHRQHPPVHVPAPQEPLYVGWHPAGGSMDMHVPPGPGCIEQEYPAGQVCWEEAWEVGKENAEPVQQRFGESTQFCPG